nr:GNAT family N-acetyltransferase [uncultured Allomuricauda sp.]
MDLFVEQKIPEVYSSILMGDDTLLAPQNQKSKDSAFNDGCLAYSVALIPDYLEFKVIAPKHFKSKSYYQNNLGYAIKFAKGISLEDFLKEQLKGNYRNIRKRKAKLESCYKIQYDFFHGNIALEKYSNLMQCLHDMLVRRFDQRQDVHEKLKEWDELLKVTKQKIDEKKASLFVIYDDGTPINISLNYHFKTIMFGAVSSYDIDYYKFGLGSIEKIKLMEWCLFNNYKLLDFGYGDLNYKHNWCNHVYKFKYEVGFDRRHMSATLFAKLERVKLHIKEYLKSKKVDVLYKRIITVMRLKKDKITTRERAVTYEKSNIGYSHSHSKFEKVNYHSQSSLPFKVIVNDFIYSTQEAKDSVEVLKVVNEENTYLIQGTKNVQTIIFKS